MCQNNFGIEVHEMLMPGFTRWLTTGPCIGRILQKWEVLKVYFTYQSANISASQITSSSTTETSAEGILLYLQDSLMYLWMKFLNFIVRKLEGTNEILQAVDPIVTATKDQMTNVALDILSLYMIPAYIEQVTTLDDVDPANVGNMLPLVEMDIGEDAAETYDLPELSEEDRMDFRLVARSFLIKICVELKTRLATDRSYEQARLFLNTDNALDDQFFTSHPTLDHVFETFPSLVSLSANRTQINLEWQHLHEVELPDVIREEKIVDRFWGRLEEFELENGPAFPMLCELANNVGKIPNSNASAERVWSKSGLVKPKRRNRLQFSMWRAVMLSSQLITDLVRTYLVTKIIYYAPKKRFRKTKLKFSLTRRVRYGITSLLTISDSFPIIEAVTKPWRKFG